MIINTLLIATFILRLQRVVSREAGLQALFQQDNVWRSAIGSIPFPQIFLFVTWTWVLLLTTMIEYAADVTISYSSTQRVESRFQREHDGNK